MLFRSRPPRRSKAMLFKRPFIEKGRKKKKKERKKERKEGRKEGRNEKGTERGKSEHDIIQVYINIYIVGVCCRECLPESVEVSDVNK